MKISVFGLGYVGAVSAACFADAGHEVVGVDTNPAKVQSINESQSPVVESGLGELIALGVKQGRIRATGDASDAVIRSETSIICVGTPSHPNGALDLDAVEAVSSQIGNAIGDKNHHHLIVVRSTVLPGTIRNLVLPTIEKSSGKRAGADFSVVHNPEFLREGSSISDFRNPPLTVIGTDTDSAGRLAGQLYDDIDAPLVLTSIETSEMMKYASNVWHALKVCFGNELGNICKELGVDGLEVIEHFCRDTKLNISPAYLKPGFAFGGSCLPKDTRAIAYLAKTLDLQTPVLSSILPSNAMQVERAASRIMALGQRNISVLGFSFKAGTDDLRESPQVELIERLLGKGYRICLYDRSVNLALLTGANRKYIENTIPHIGQLMVPSLEEALAHGDVIIAGNNDPEFKTVPSRIREHQIFVDLAHVGGEDMLGDRYESINW